MAENGVEQSGGMTQPFEWQPIETAPKDGSWMLLTGGEIDCGWDSDAKTQIVVGQYVSEGSWQFAWYDGGYYGEYEEPTHWMPLPAPPKAPE